MNARISIAFGFTCTALALHPTQAVAAVIDATQPPYSATGNGTTPDNAAINSALATGKTVYLPATPNCYKITAPLIMSTPDQLMYGDGRTRSTICVTSTFSGGAIQFTSGEPGPQLRDLGIRFTQPDTANRSSLIQYQPAILAQGTPRFRINGLRISGAWVGIDMSGNSGGATIDDLEISAFSKGIWVDGSQDTVRLNNVHSWPFGLTTAQTAAFYDPNSVSFYVGRCDGIVINNGVSIAGTGIVFFQGTSGPPLGQVTNFSFDSFNGVVMSAGMITMSSVYFTLVSNKPVQAIKINGGTLTVSSYFALAGPTSVPMVEITGSGNGTALNLTGGIVNLGSQNSTFLSAVPAGGSGRVGLINNYFQAVPNVLHTNPVINVPAPGGIRIAAFGNQIQDKGSNTGTFFSVGRDDWDKIVGNAPLGWTNTFPAPPSSGTYQWSNP